VSSRLRADILFILIGAIPIIVAAQLDREQLARDLCKDFGVVIVSLALVDLLWQLVAGGEPLTKEIDELRDLNVLTRQAHEHGLVDLASRRSLLTIKNAVVEAQIKNSTSSIDMSGYTLYFLVENPRFVDALIERARGKVRVRLLMCSPDNGDVNATVDESVLSTMKQQMAVSWDALLRARTTLPEVDRDNFEVRRLRKKSLLTSLLRFDDQITVLPYLLTKYTQEAPVYVVKGADKELFKIYLREYDYYFELAGEGENPPTNR
jgi:hypothetical protein